jgi:membrane protease YdiL (CAAX protease family)
MGFWLDALLSSGLYFALPLGFAGLALLLATLVPPALLGAFRPEASGYAPFVPVPGPTTPSSAPSTFGFFALQSLAEELLFRAFFLTLLAALVLLLARLLFGRLPRPEEPLRARRVWPPFWPS